MFLSRLFSVLAVVAVAIGMTAFACGGDDGGGGGGGNADAKVFMDAPAMTPDAAMAMGIGAPCTTMTPGGQGTCPTGYTCLQLNGGTGAWCSKTCMQGSADQCPVGYTGPGVARCIYNITFQGSGSGTGSSALFCGVICADTTGTCGSACSGTCPGALQCTRPLMSGSGATVGSACF